MIRNAGEMVTEIKNQMRGGKGSIKMTHIFKQDELIGKSRLVAKITINPGSSIGMHDHTGEEEIYYITGGKGIVNDNGITKEVTVGDAILTGNGASHSIENNGVEPLEFVAVILVY